MTDDPDQPTPLLEYQKPAPPTKRVSAVFFRWLIGFVTVGLLLVAYTLATSHFEMLAAYVIFAPFAMMTINVVYVIRARRKNANRSDEEEEEEWQKREQQYQEMVEVARGVYARAPVGCWRVTYGASHQLGGATISQRRMIEFKSDGSGVYQGIDVGGLNTPVRVVFRHKPGDQPLRLLVEMIDPPFPGWHEVEFNFAINTHLYGGPTLVLWFHAENPMPDDLAEMWPFQREFLREG